MTHSPAHHTATVLPLKRRLSGDDGLAALQITAACPGWRVWRSLRDRQWHARRAIGSCQSLEGGQAYMVSAPDPERLLAALEQQARLDIAAEYPGWDVAQTGSGRWWAVWTGGSAAPRMTMVCAITAMALLSALRGLNASHRLPRPAEGPRDGWPEQASRVRRRN